LLFNSFELEDLYNSYEKGYTFSFSTACLNPLSISQVLSLYEQEEQESLQKGILNLELDYSAKYGLEEFSYTLKGLYKSEIKSLSTSGAAEAIILLFSSLFTAGDTLIIQKPIYPSLYQIPQGLGCKIIDWDFKWAEDFKLNLESLKKIINENPEVKALVINNPNNPCGYCFNEAELKELIHTLNGKYIISDEVFRDICLKPTPAIADLYEKGISISDVSKAYGLQGLRAGWIATQDEKIIEKCLSQKSYFSLRTSILSEKIAALALNKREILLKNSKELIQKGLNKIYKDPSAIKLISPKLFNNDNSTSASSNISGTASVNLPQDHFGGLCLLAKLNPETIPSVLVENFFQKLIEQKIFILPGRVFGDRYSEYFRLSVLRIP
jgi:aspartate/methionine/tyrosine aminotransferase